MKVIELLNKIANGEEVPEEIIYKGKTYYAEFNGDSEKYYYCDDEDNLLLENIDCVDQLDEVIEEDKKIEKVNEDEFNDLHNNTKIILLKNKINEIIDYINKEK